jgi:ketosteroid isomerase-like protein
MTTFEQFIPQYESALATQQWENVAPLIHEDCVVTFNDGTYKGKTEVEATFRRTFALIQDEIYSISNIHWVQKTESIAVLIYNFSWSGIINGQPASGSGRGTSVLTQQDGKWQLICEHLGPNAI